MNQEIASYSSSKKAHYISKLAWPVFLCVCYIRCWIVSLFGEINACCCSYALYCLMRRSRPSYIYGVFFCLFSALPNECLEILRTELARKRIYALQKLYCYCLIV